jgi:hypothetical protein
VALQHQDKAPQAVIIQALGLAAVVVAALEQRALITEQMAQVLVVTAVLG